MLLLLIIARYSDFLFKWVILIVGCYTASLKSKINLILSHYYKIAIRHLHYSRLLKPVYLPNVDPVFLPRIQICHQACCICWSGAFSKVSCPAAKNQNDWLISKSCSCILCIQCISFHWKWNLWYTVSSAVVPSQTQLLQSR